MLSVTMGRKVQTSEGGRQKDWIKNMVIGINSNKNIDYMS